MAHATRTTVTAALCAVLALGCTMLTGKTAGRNVDDATITTAVKTNLATAKVDTLTRIDVDTEKGTVYLRGNVDSPAMKQRAAEIARAVNGVEKVVNNLTVVGSSGTRGDGSRTR
jgi:osmotically-inducible protein OsmY